MPRSSKPYEFRAEDASWIITYLENRSWEWWEDSPLEPSISYASGLSSEHRLELYELRDNIKGLNDWLHKSLAPEHIQRLRQTLRKKASKRELGWQRVRVDLTRDAHDLLLRAILQHKERTGEELTLSQVIEKYFAM